MCVSSVSIPCQTFNLLDRLDQKKLDFFTLETHTSSSCLSLQRGKNIWSVKHWQHWFCRHSPSTLFTTSSPLWPQQPCHDFQLIPWPGSWHWWLVPTPTHWRAHMEKRESSFWQNWACNNLRSWLWSLLVGMGQTQYIYIYTVYYTLLYI